MDLETIVEDEIFEDNSGEENKILDFLKEELKENHKVSNISNIDLDKLEILKDKFKNESRIIMYSNINKKNKDYYYQIYKAKKAIDFFCNIDNNILVTHNSKLAVKNFLLKNRKLKSEDATDKSNINELNLDYYDDMIKTAKIKNRKYSVELIENPVDLTKEISDEYIEKCKNSFVKKRKFEKKIPAILSNPQLQIDTKPEEAKESDFDFIIIFKSTHLFLKKDTSKEDLLKVIKDKIEEIKDKIWK